MDVTHGPSHIRYALRTLFWLSSSIVCMVFGHELVEENAGVNLPAVTWSSITVVLVPLAHTVWAGRRPEADARWAGTLRSCAIGVGIGVMLDSFVVFRSPNPMSATVGAVLSAALATGAILLPRLVLRALAPGIFGEEASIEGFRGHRGRRLLANLFAGSIVAGVLLSIAVPNFMVFALRTKSGEARVEIEAIRMAQEAWYAEHGHYLPTTALPEGPPGPQRVGFDSDAHAASGFERLGWPLNPNKQLYCRYAVTVENVDGGMGGYTIEAVCDLDGDGEQMAFGWLKPALGSRVGVPGQFGYCTVRGVLPGRGARGDERLFNRFGPCDATSTVSRF
ncbi:MAG: hypothetical protein JRG94_22260 [Deltaproteobacteria bacterium]|nr:hypothetical protein [Deltaproteobacteria bacterium]